MNRPPKKRQTHYFVLWGILLQIMYVNIIAAEPLPDTIEINPNFKKVEIGSKCLLRTGPAFTRFMQTDSSWKAASSNNISLTPDEIHWIFGLLKNTSLNDEGLKLYLNHIQTGPMHLYVLVDGKLIVSEITGSILPLSQRATKDRTLSFPLRIPAGKTAEFYIRSQRREIAMTISLLLSNPLSDKSLPWEDTTLLIALSFIAVVFLTAIMMMAYAPSKNTMYFLIYILFGLLYVMAASGYGSLYLWSSMPWFEENAAAFLAAASICGLLGFSKSILQLHKEYRRINFMINAFMLIYPLVTLTGFALYFDKLKPGVYSAFMNIMYLFLLILFFTILYISAYKAMQKKQKEYYWFVIIFSFFAFLSIVTILFETGIWEYNYKTHVIFLIVSSVPQMTLTLLFLINKLVATLKQRTREVEEVRAESDKILLSRQLRISRELHDEVGATLSGIAMYSHLTKTQLQSQDLAGVENSLNIMQDSSAQMVNKLNDIVWLINPDKSSLPDIIQRLEEYARNMAATKNMEVKVNVSEDIKQMQLSMEQRRNIYLFCKEAINNAVKYSEGTLLQLKVVQEKDIIVFSVIDNGKGFDATTVRKGNGLNSLQQRAQEMNGIYQVITSAEKGTQIICTIKPVIQV